MITIKERLKFWIAALVLIFTSCANAADIVCRPLSTPITVDGSASDWTGVEGFPLPNGKAELKIAHSPQRIYVLLQLNDPEEAYLTLCKGMKLWIDSEGGNSLRYGLCYSGSLRLAAEIDANHNPMSKESSNAKPPLPEKIVPLEIPHPGEGRPPKPLPDGTPPPGGDGFPPGGPRGVPPRESDNSSTAKVKEVFKRTMDPGILLVTQGSKGSIQLECLQDGPCARSGYENQLFIYEFSILWNDLPSDITPPAAGEAVKINLGLKLPELQPDHESVLQMAPEGMQSGGTGGKGGGPGGGMGGGPGGGMGGGPGGGMGGGPGGGMGGGPGGGMGGEPGGGPGGGRGMDRPKAAHSYSVAAFTHWYPVVILPEEKK